jgi:SAM-dependent methyltransferase
VSALLRSNYNLERHLDTELMPQLDNQKKELERLRQKLHQAESSGVPREHQAGRAGSATRWGDLRRASPISTEWGADRGRCIDRYYIEQFIEANAKDIWGTVLEVHDSDYTVRFGGDRVQRSDVIDIDPTNPRATIVADLRNASVIPAHTFDCFIMTQTLHVIYDMRAVLAECVRILKPGGVLLATLPCAGKIAPEQGLDGDFWRFTEAAARKLFSEFFPEDRLEVRSYGNILTSVAYFYGLACHELRADEFGIFDPRLPLIVSVRAETSSRNADER